MLSGPRGVVTEPCRVGDNRQVSTSSDRTGGDTFYDEIGGYPTIAKIVDRFYEGVAQDEVLRPIYPEQDLGPAADRFTKFLAQYWGGPSTYSDERGHPRLRMRHAPFKVNPQARDHWLLHFRAGLDAANLTPEQDEKFWDYVTHAAQFMVNSFED